MTQPQIHVLTPETVEVGQGVTYSVGSDRYAGTIVQVSASGKTVSFTDDEAHQVGDYFGSQEWVYESVRAGEWVDPLGETRSNVSTARWSAKRGRFVYSGRALSGGRNAHSDPSF